MKAFEKEWLSGFLSKLGPCHPLLLGFTPVVKLFSSICPNHIKIGLIIQFPTAHLTEHCSE